MAGDTTDTNHVELLRREASDFDCFEPGSFDTIILNSIVQYFPNVDYLLAVIKRVVELVGPHGRIFVGDLRHFGLLELFHTSVQFAKAATRLSVMELQSRIARAIAQEKELLIDPQFFVAMQEQLPNITRVDLLLKQGQSNNELTRYRYDVILYIGDQAFQLRRCS